MRQSVTNQVTVGDKVDTWMSVSAQRQRTFTLTMTGGEADLYVLDANCLLIFCASTNPGSATETCVVNVPGPLFPQVEWISGTVDYTLSTNAPPASDQLGVFFPDGYPSDDCGGVDLLTGQANTTYVTARLERFTNETWACVRVDAGSARAGGKLVLSDPVAPTVDSNSAACNATGNTAPGSHPIAGAFGGDFVDVYQNADEIWVCASAQSNNVRLVFPTGTGAAFYVDKAELRPAASPPPGDPNSGSCQAAGFATRFVDVTSAGNRTYLYLLRTTTDWRFCVRSGNYGGVLAVRTTVPSVATPSVTPGTGPCTGNVVSFGQIQISNGVASGNAAVCLQVGSNAVSVSIVQPPLSAPPTVSWTPDAGTPGI